jgi:tRNA threonylcarbamoyladenosine biosynthesis protein TsaB
MALILHIETATDVCSVALADENGLIDLFESTEGRSHAAILTVFIEDMLKKNHMKVSDLGAIAVSMGPGSYTGLRIGVSVAKGLCYGANIPLLALPTLQSMAHGFLRQYHDKPEMNSANIRYCPMIDARRLEVYTALFDYQGEFTSDIKAEIIDSRSFEDLLTDHVIYFFGNGSDKCSGIITHPNARFISGLYPSARDLIVLSQKAYQKKEFKDVAYFEPFYLKDFVTTTPKNKVIG